MPETQMELFGPDSDQPAATTAPAVQPWDGKVCHHCGAVGARCDGAWWTGSEWIRAPFCADATATGPGPCTAAQRASEKAGKAANRRPRAPRAERVAYGDYAIMCAMVNGQRRR